MKYLLYDNNDKKSSRPTVFLHGFKVPPNKNTRFLKLLSKYSEVIAPDMVDRKHIPTSLDEYVEIISEFLHKHTLDDINLVGYSLGGGITFELANRKEVKIDKLAGLNPLIPVKYRGNGFIRNGFIYGITDVFQEGINGIPKRAKSLVNFLKNYTRSPINNTKLIYDIGKYSMDGYKITQPSLIAIGSKDAFFSLDKLVSGYHSKFSDMTLEIMPNKNHNINDYSWMASRLVKDFFIYQDKTKKYI